jgi:hypothetical protein
MLICLFCDCFFLLNCPTKNTWINF